MSARIIDTHLETVTEKVEHIWDRTIAAYESSIKAFVENNRKRALKISRDDRKINNLDEEVNEDIIRVITLQAPVAGDLRKLISALKISNQLERIADYTVNLADHVLISDDEETSTVVDKNIVEMLEHIVKMLESAKKAFQLGDAELAVETIEMDQFLDSKYNRAIKKLAKVVQDDVIESDDETEMNMNSILMVKYLERAGDHITNICESIYYMVKGRVYDDHHTQEISLEDLENK